MRQSISLAVICVASLCFVCIGLITNVAALSLDDIDELDCRDESESHCW